MTSALAERAAMTTEHLEAISGLGGLVLTEAVARGQRLPRDGYLAQLAVFDSRARLEVMVFDGQLDLRSGQTAGTDGDPLRSVQFDVPNPRTMAARIHRAGTGRSMDLEYDSSPTIMRETTGVFTAVDSIRQEAGVSEGVLPEAPRLELARHYAGPRDLSRLAAFASALMGHDQERAALDAKGVVALAMVTFPRNGAGDVRAASWTVAMPDGNTTVRPHFYATAGDPQCGRHSGLPR